MKSKYILIFFFLLFAVAACSVETKAQSIWGASVIAWDDDAPNIDGLSITAVDYYAGAYYDPYVYGCLYSIYGESCISEGESYGYDYYIPAQVYHPLFQSQRLNTYCVYSEHWAVAVYQVNYYQWWDAYGFSYFGGGEMGNNVPWYGYFTYTYVPRDVYIGWTEVCHTVPLDQCDAGSATCQQPTVTISPVDVVQKDGERTVNVSVANAQSSDTTKFTIRRTAGTGSATFDDGTTEKSLTGNFTNTPLKLKGVTESSQVNNFVIEARMNNDSTVLKSDEFTVPVVTSITVERINAGDLALDNNPGTDGTVTAGEGLRVFPDKNNGGETLDRSILRVKATVAPAAANLNVYFNSYDLDDPSTSSTIDTNGAAGNDNNGQAGGSGAGQFTIPGGISCTNAVAGSFSKVDCTTAANGTAEARFQVTMQPGDNFAVVASVDDVYRNGINLNGSDGSKINNGAGQEITTAQTSVPGMRTEMLTVWRRLHVEVDSMGSATGNNVTGTIPTAASVPAGQQTLTVEVTSAANTLEANRFEGGRIVIGGTSLQVVGNTVSNPLWGGGDEFGGSGSGSAETGEKGEDNIMYCPYTYLYGGGCYDPPDPTPTPFITPTPTPTPTATPTPTPPPTRTMQVTVTVPTAFNITANQAFTLYDDDDFNDSDGTNVDGDNGEDISTPDTSKMADTSSPCTATVASGCNTLATAYIVPKYDLTGGGENITFVLNIPSTRPALDDILSSNNGNFDNFATEASAEFWTIYLLGGYQLGEESDGDPRTTNAAGLLIATYGASNASANPPRSIDGYGSVILNEMARAREYPSNFASRPVNNAYTTVHEVGHLFGSIHGDGDLMEITQTRTGGLFSDTTVAQIRKVAHP